MNVVKRPAFGKVTVNNVANKPSTSIAPVEETIQPSEFFSSIDRITSNKTNNKTLSSNSLSSTSNIPKNSSTQNNSSSASSLLDAIKQRNQIIDLNSRRYSRPNIRNNDQNESLEPINVEQTYQELLENLRQFIAFKSKVNGEATTAEVLDHFQDKIPTDQTAIFKALLWKLCNFVRRNGEGFWVLKSDFR